MQKQLVHAGLIHPCMEDASGTQHVVLLLVSRLCDLQHEALVRATRVVYSVVLKLLVTLYVESTSAGSLEIPLPHFWHFEPEAVQSGE